MNNVVNCMTSITDNRTIVVANDGYNFINSKPYYSEGKSMFKYNLRRISDNEYIITSNECLGDYNKINITAIATPITSIKKTYGNLSVHAVTMEQLREILDKQFPAKPHKGTLYQDNSTVYINKIFRLCFNVDSEYFCDKKYPVNLGDNHTEIETEVINQPVVKLSCGSIKIPEMYNCSVDYTNTKVLIYIPFVGLQELDARKVLNRDIELTYEVNIVDGTAYAKLTDYETSWKCKLSFEFPYTSERLSKISRTLIDINVASLQPCIYVTRPTLLDTRTKPYNKTDIFDVIGKFTGYSEIQDVQYTVLNESITKTEISEIKSLLSKGIIL